MLFRSDLDLPIPAPLDDLRIAPRYPELIAALESCDFRGLTAEVRAESTTVHTPPQGELF